MKNVSLTFSIQVSGLKCHYEQYFPPAQPLLPGGGFCATSSVFPFPLLSIKIRISVCMCSAKFLFVAVPPLAKRGRPWMGPREEALPWPGSRCGGRCGGRGSSAAAVTWCSKRFARQCWLAECRLRILCPRLPMEAAGWGAPPSSCSWGAASVLRTPLRSAGAASPTSCCCWSLFWPRKERGSAGELLLREAN